MIHVFGNYYIFTDPMNYSVYKVSKITTGMNKGKNSKTLVGHYGKLEDAVMAVIDAKVKAKLIDETDMEFAELMSIYKCEYARYDELYQKTKKALRNES